jgi:hypothetical protein
MNSQQTVSIADALARRAMAEAGSDVANQVARVWRLVFGARPTESEAAASLSFLEQQRELLNKAADRPKDLTAEAAALSTLCQALMSSNRFLYID